MKGFTPPKTSSNCSNLIDSGGSASMKPAMAKERLVQAGYFLMGFMPAVIVAMVLLLTSSEAKTVSYKNSIKSGPTTLILSVGSSGFRTQGAVPPGGGPPPPPGQPPPQAPVASRPDTLFIVYGRSPGDKEKIVLGKDFEGDRITLSVYKAYLNAGPTRLGDTKLAYSREISYDTRLFGIDPDTLAEVKQIKKAFEDEAKRADKGDD